MLFALVDGNRRKASPRLSGQCPGCGSALIPKCGELRAWHWAHRGERRCDPWWEESEWHRKWKDRFPPEWQEIVQLAPNGEKHIADIRTPDGRVIEFQHSPLAKEERDARETFYKPMFWVVDGLVRKRDLKNFNKIVEMARQGAWVSAADMLACALVRDWVGRPVHVFFDFGEPILWHLHPSLNGRVAITPLSVEAFVAAFHNSVSFRPTPTKRDRAPAPIVPTLWRRRRRYARF